MEWAGTSMDTTIVESLSLMLKLMDAELQQIIEQGQQFSFRNNCYTSEIGTFSTPSIELQAWIAVVEHYIIENYSEDSAPYRLFSEFDRRYLDNFYQDEFDKQLRIILGALQACKSIPQKPKSSTKAADELLLNIFDKFHNVARQLRNRYNNRPTLDVTDEYDVQDLLHSLLKLYFDDIRKEEWTPSYAGGSARMDFLLKDEKTVIEVKKTRNGLGDKELGNQLIEDKARYSAHQDCRRLICFTYDPEGRIINPKGIQKDLNFDTDEFKVIIIIKP